jgi:hypothetical protein
MSDLWLQTIGGGLGDWIDPEAIPPDRLAAARSAIQRALVAGKDGVLIVQRLGYRLCATVDESRLLLTMLAAGGEPIVTIAVAPRAGDGDKLWPMMVKAASEQGQPVTFRRPQEPWALVFAYPSAMMRLASDDDLGWLAVLEAQLSCAWLEKTLDKPSLG